MFTVAGETQACILTKSQPFYELPSAVSDLERIPDIPDQVTIWVFTGTTELIHTLGNPPRKSHI